MHNFDWTSWHEEATDHLRALLRCDTRNPPGGEHLAVAYVASQFDRFPWLTYEIIESAPGRQNIVARLRGSGAERPLMLLSHLDVVPVDPEHWTVDPFGGEIRDGYLYGRGAYDMKLLTAQELTIFLHIATACHEQQTQPVRDLIFLAVADEERGGVFGVRWLLEHRPDIFTDVAWVLNEGGGNPLTMNGKTVFTFEAGQKGSARIQLRATGDPGHASMPHTRNAVVRLGRAIHRLGSAPLPLHVTGTVRQFVTTLANQLSAVQRTVLLRLLTPGLSNVALQALPDEATRLAMQAMLHNTVTPTMLEAGKALNVIPSEALATLDCRIIPGQAENVAAEIRARIADPSVTITIELDSPGYETTVNTPFFASAQAAIAKHVPGAIVAPYLFPAVSDSRFLAPLGIACYGFMPVQHEQGQPAPYSLAHGHDERISLANVGFGLCVLGDLLTPLL